MKKVFGLLAVVAMITFSSCASTECTCTISASGEGAEYFPTTTTTFEAEGNCSDGNTTTTSGGLTLTTVCK